MRGQSAIRCIIRIVLTGQRVEMWCRSGLQWSDAGCAILVLLVVLSVPQLPGLAKGSNCNVPQPINNDQQHARQRRRHRHRRSSNPDTHTRTHALSATRSTQQPVTASAARERCSDLATSTTAEFRLAVFLLPPDGLSEWECRVVVETMAGRWNLNLPNNGTEPSHLIRVAALCESQAVLHSSPILDCICSDRLSYPSYSSSIAHSSTCASPPAVQPSDVPVASPRLAADGEPTS